MGEAVKVRQRRSIGTSMLRIHGRNLRLINSKKTVWYVVFSAADTCHTLRYGRALRWCFAEIVHDAISQTIGRNRPYRAGLLQTPRSLVVQEEVETVLLNRAAD